MATTANRQEALQTSAALLDNVHRQFSPCSQAVHKLLRWKDDLLRDPAASRGLSDQMLTTLTVTASELFLGMMGTEKLLVSMRDQVGLTLEIAQEMPAPGVLRWLRLAWRASRRVYLSEQVLMRYRTARLLELWEQSVQSLPQTPARTPRDLGEHLDAYLRHLRQREMLQRLPLPVTDVKLTPRKPAPPAVPEKPAAAPPAAKPEAKKEKAPELPPKERALPPPGPQVERKALFGGGTGLAGAHAVKDVSELLGRRQMAPPPALGGKIGAKAAAASSAWSSTKVPGRSSSPLPAAAQRPADKLPVRSATGSPDVSAEQAGAGRRAGSPDVSAEQPDAGRRAGSRASDQSAGPRSDAGSPVSSQGTGSRPGSRAGLAAAPGSRRGSQPGTASGQASMGGSEAPNSLHGSEERRQGKGPSGRLGQSSIFQQDDEISEGAASSHGDHEVAAEELHSEAAPLLLQNINTMLDQLIPLPGDTAPFGNPQSSSRGAARPAAPILNISSFQRREAAAAGTEDVAAGASGGTEAAVASGVQGAGAAYQVEAGLLIAGAGLAQETNCRCTLLPAPGGLAAPPSSATSQNSDRSHLWGTSAVSTDSHSPLPSFDPAVLPEVAQEAESQPPGSLGPFNFGGAGPAMDSLGLGAQPGPMPAPINTRFMRRSSSNSRRAAQLPATAGVGLEPHLEVDWQS